MPSWVVGGWRASLGSGFSGHTCFHGVLRSACSGWLRLITGESEARGTEGSRGVWEVQGYAAAAAAYAPSHGNKGIFVSRGEGALTVRNSQYFWASDPNCELSNHVSAEAVSFAWLNISTEMIQTSPTVYTARHLGCWNILGWLMCPFTKRADLQEEGLLKEAELYLKAYT